MSLTWWELNPSTHLPQTSQTANALVFRLGVLADFIHIDAAHEYGPVREDIRIW